MGFGFILFVDCFRYILQMCLECRYAQNYFLFKYFGFEWVVPPPGNGINWVYGVLGILALGIYLGFFYRFCIILFTIGFTYTFLLDQAYYLNHFYMVILFAVLLAVVPAHRYWSLDAYRNPEWSKPTTPRWSIWLLAAQLEIILLYAGIVKINWDWLNLEPLRLWLGEEADFPVLGELFTQTWSVAFASYGVIALHLIGAPLLMVAKARIWVMVVYASFHTLNHFVFNIGIFPWMTLFASLLFFSPGWPRHVVARLMSTMSKYSLPNLVPAKLSKIPNNQPGKLISVPLAIFLVVWLMFHSLVPLRHWLYPGDVAWNEEGHRFSWRMKLRTKRGKAIYTVRTEDGYAKVDPLLYISPKQYRKMSCIPDMLLQFGHHLGEVYKGHGYKQVQVMVDAKCSLNGRPQQVLIDPNVDLTKIERNLGHATWITELETPLPNPILPWSK